MSRISTPSLESPVTESPIPGALQQQAHMQQEE